MTFAVTFTTLSHFVLSSHNNLLTVMLLWDELGFPVFTSFGYFEAISLLLNTPVCELEPELEV